MKSTSEKIKSCPFCGMAPVVWQEIDPSRGYGWVVRCLTTWCPALPMVKGPSEGLCKTRWNRRAGAPEYARARRVTIARMRAKLRDLRDLAEAVVSELT